VTTDFAVIVAGATAQNPSIRFVDGLEKIQAWWSANEDEL
jgi:hypothetical protein